MTDAGIRRITLLGTMQEGHRGSAGQGKRRTDPGAAPHGKPECSLGLLLVVLKLYPELHSGKPPGRLKNMYCSGVLSYFLAKIMFCRSAGIVCPCERGLIVKA
ncbi:unnamed protein product [Staurois parvus]|uniref:Uncharacterized protein n=1 Tax=Staurois parvus TaxID=386267 RepID=A0ABN9EDQ9_9NEOB|nr:unnamed protein product [Staurois parvus]